MGDVAGDLLQALHQGGDAVQHPVEGQRQPIEVVVGAADRHAAGQVAVDDRLRRARDRRQPAVDAAAHCKAARHAQHHDAQEGAAEAAQQRPVERLDPFLLVTDQQEVTVGQPNRQQSD